jgi:hypothetical protein
MGHYCRICGRERPNEQFSGKGHKIHVCKRCQAKPKTERRAIEDQDDIFGFLKQSHISQKNVIHLGQMAKSDSPQVASLAEDCPGSSPDKALPNLGTQIPCAEASGTPAQVGGHGLGFCPYLELGD